MQLVYCIESLIQVPIKRKRIHWKEKPIHMEILSNESLKQKKKAEIDLLKKEKEEEKLLQLIKIKELTEILLNSDSKVIKNAKIECLKIALLSILAWNFHNNADYLLAISNSISSSLQSANFICRVFASERLIELLALRQRQIIVPEYIFKEEYSGLTKDSTERFCAIYIEPTVLTKHGLQEDAEFFVDKKGAGSLAVPPYVRIYKKIVPFEIQKQKSDYLGKKLSEEGFVEMLVSQSILDHESKEEQELTGKQQNMVVDGDGLSDDPFDDASLEKEMNMLRRESGQIVPVDSYFSEFSSLFPAEYISPAKFYSMSQSAFYQSCFEFYGPSLMDKFINVIEKKLEERKTNHVLAVAIEIIGGFMRSSKCFKSNSIEKITQQCYKILYSIFKLGPMEVITFLLMFIR